MDWPDSVERLIREQEALAVARPPPWRPLPGAYPIGGCFLCFPRGRPGPGSAGDPAWAGAALIAQAGGAVTRVVAGAAGAPYRPGLLALREGPLLAAAIGRLPRRPEVLLVNATGRDHPRGAGLALHLGAVLGVPTVGVTHRPLLAIGPWPEPIRGACSPLRLDGAPVGHWLCTRDGTRPLAVHAGWRTDPEMAIEIVLAAGTGASRTPEPIRAARRTARQARTAAGRARRPESGTPRPAAWSRIPLGRTRGEA